MRLCFEAHREQTDKAGLPYVFHPFHLAEQMPDEDTTVAALLHDVVEDTAYTPEDLRAMGFSGAALERAEKYRAAIRQLSSCEDVPEEESGS